VAYWNWVVQCKNPGCEDQIELLRPNLLGIIDDPIWSPNADLRMLFLCPVCGFVYAYTAADFHKYQAPNAAPYLSPASSLPSIEFSCAEENCETLARVYMHGENLIDRNELVSRMERGTIRVECPSGHLLKMPEGELLRVKPPMTYPRS
jgi:hypothetical protein